MIIENALMSTNAHAIKTINEPDKRTTGMDAMRS